MDHTSGSGNYVYMNAALSSGASNAVLRSPAFNTNGATSVTISFWYHMYGSNVGSLALDVIDGSGTRQVWSCSGNQGPGWRQATVSMWMGDWVSQHLRFRATRPGGSALGDIALDDIQIVAQN
jgi:hypothetical protein